MSKRTREINRITTAIISISVKLILYALIILLLYEAVVQGFAFGHAVFYAEAVDAEPGRDVTVVIGEGESVAETAEQLSRQGLIKNAYAFRIQSVFYKYDTMYPGTYTLNTSMTSRAILQRLGEKPEEEEEETAAAVRAASETGTGAAETTAAASGRQAATEETQEETQVYDEPEEASYYGDGQEEEGGWIEDIGEEAAQ